MTRPTILAALAFSLLPATGFAQFGGTGQPPGVPGSQSAQAAPPDQGPKVYRVKIETAKGVGVTGTLTLATVDVDGDLGVYQIQAEKVKEIRFSEAKEGKHPVTDGRGTRVEGTVVVTSGDEIAGTLLVPSWVVKTDLGQVTLAPGKIKSVTFLDQKGGEQGGKKDGKGGEQGGKKDGKGGEQGGKKDGKGDAPAEKK